MDSVTASPATAETVPRHVTGTCDSTNAAGVQKRTRCVLTRLTKPALFTPFPLSHIHIKQINNPKTFHMLGIFTQVGFLPQQNNFSAQQSQRQAQSQHKQQQRLHSSQKSQAPARPPLTAVSSLRAAVGEDAPLIHIIQELRDNCVISEVRVNREKMPKGKNSCSSKVPTTTKRRAPQPTECIEYQPTAPALSNISEQETPLEECCHEMMEKEPPASLAGDSQVTSKSRRSSRRSSSGAGGRLLQKRLSGGSVNFKTRDAQQPPPKPPRRSTQSLDDKFSLSSLSSTTPSVRDAERVLDEFLRKHGVQLPSSAKPESYGKSQKSKRKSFPQGK